MIGLIDGSAPPFIFIAILVATFAGVVATLTAARGDPAVTNRFSALVLFYMGCFGAAFLAAWLRIVERASLPQLDAAVVRGYDQLLLLLFLLLATAYFTLPLMLLAHSLASKRRDAD
jgi:hypothetical protein